MATRQYEASDKSATAIKMRIAVAMVKDEFTFEENEKPMYDKAPSISNADKFAAATKQYKEFLENILKNGVRKDDRTGTGTISLFGPQMEFDLRDGFPIVTTKKLFLKGVIAELLWFLEGSTDERRLAEIQYGKNRRELKDKSTIWTANANAQGKALGYRNDDLVKELGPIYGYSWRIWEGNDGRIHDQIAEVIESIKNNSDSRRHIVSAWNVPKLNEMSLPPCHTMFQFYVSDGYLDCKLYQRSADAFLGVPYNITSYSLLLMMIAQVTGLKPRRFIHTFGDAHIYLNHIEQVKEQLSRECYKLPEMKINPEITNIDDFKMDDFELINYKSHDTIKAEMAV
jgi:thymidylate synthase